MDEQNEHLEFRRMVRLATALRSRRKTSLVTELIAEKLNKQIAEGHDVFAFSIAITLALTKDGVDVALDFLFGVGEIPILGQIPGYIISGILTNFLLGKGWLLKPKIRLTYYVLGLFVDNLPLANNLPLSALTILYAWHNVREQAKQSQGRLEELGRASEKRIKEIEKELFEEESETAYA
ncbi:MAG: hypothetical protein AAB846_02435 [Patescibacteria group bacterium]